MWYFCVIEVIKGGEKTGSDRACRVLSTAVEERLAAVVVWFVKFPQQGLI